MTTDAAREARSAFEVGEQLNLALERIAELGRQLERAREDAAERDAVITALQDSWRTIDGRTLRHDAGLDAVRELRAVVDRLGERLEEESALRREALAALAQAREHDSAAAEGAGSRAEDSFARLVAVEEQTRHAEAERRRLATGVGAIEDAVLQTAGRLNDVDARLSAARDVERAILDGLATVEGRVAESAAAFADLDVRTREAESERRLLNEAVAALQSTRAREAELLDLIEQQRSSRQRIEERLMAIEEGLTATGRALLEAAEQRAQLRLHAGGLERQLTQLDWRFTEQRELVQRQWRALLDADDVAEARVVSDLERRSRERRELLRRLTEENEQAAQGGSH